MPLFDGKRRLVIATTDTWYLVILFLSNSQLNPLHLNNKHTLIFLFFIFNKFGRILNKIV